MSMISILATMPDVAQRILIEHVPDEHGQCWECRDVTGVAASWPCDARMIAEDAEAFAATAWHSLGAARREPVLRPV